MNKCKDCKIEIDNRSKRCHSCASKNKHNGNYKSGIYCIQHYCVDCGNPISICSVLYGSHKCKSCVKKTKNHKEFYCQDCNKKISYGRKRCKSCARKYQYKINPDSNPMSGKFGDKNPNWKGGITKLINKIRNSKQYRLWVKKIFKRDNYTCQVCYNIGHELNVHHKIPLSNILILYSITTTKQALKCKLLRDINNGITLCRKHHEDIEPKLKNSKNRILKGDK